MVAEAISPPPPQLPNNTTMMNLSNPLIVTQHYPSNAKTHSIHTHDLTKAYKKKKKKKKKKFI